MSAGEPGRENCGRDGDLDTFEYFLPDFVAVFLCGVVHILLISFYEREGCKPIL